jgi:hypothetical protein
MTEIKLCKDCKHYKKDWITHLIERSDKFDKCLNPIFLHVNRVTGKRTTEGKFCDVQRDYDCGRDGKYWEAK